MNTTPSPDIDNEIVIGEPVGFRLSSQLILGLSLLIILILAVSSTVVWLKGRPLMIELGLRSQVQLGQNVALALEQELAEIAGITRSMAALSTALPHDSETFQRSIPPILNQLGPDSVIAGGGIWPEPYAFARSQVRNSFFWGRNANAELVFIEDYNNPNGPGYHNEEWYAPARLLSEGAVYWSKSYTDPYSLQPMVTCSAPVFDNGVFSGVATVDLRLDRVSKILEKLSSGMDAYAFVVDRNNKFIAYPYPDRVITTRSETNSPSPDFIYASELADIQPSFAEFATHLDSREKKLQGNIALTSEVFSTNVSLLEKSSYQIDMREARRIVAHLLSRSGKLQAYPELVDQFTIDRDSILAEPATAIVFHMPNTNWKVVTVFRKSAYLTLIDTVSRELVQYLIITTLAFGLIAYLVLRNRVLKPVREMVDQLTVAVSDPSKLELRFHYGRQDELGLLAHWFNLRTKQLEIARDQAENASKAKTEFLAKMSHELRTPLNSIIGFSRRLIKKLDGEIDEFYLEALHRIHSNGNHLLELIRDILDLSAVESGATRLHLSWASTNEILAEAQAEVRFLAEDRKLDIRVYPLADDKKIHCDKYRVVQILAHLLKNAINATTHGQVRIRVFETDRKQGYIGFEVSDSGVGISEYDQKRLFKKFTQLNERLGAEPGTGLGLFLVSKFLQLHNGEIMVSSKIGEGSIFTAYLPIEAATSCDTTRQ